MNDTSKITPNQTEGQAEAALAAEVLVYHYDEQRKRHVKKWFPCSITGYRTGGVGEDFRRVDVTTSDGRKYLGCHPDCVREVEK
jgi:hypothetical protein